MVDYACNSNYLGGRDRKIIVQCKSWQKLMIFLFKQQARYALVIQLVGRQRQNDCGSGMPRKKKCKTLLEK
jgi:hypothetical protein